MMMLNKSDPRKGFTLIELIVAVMLMAILSGVLASILAVNIDTISEISNRKKMIGPGMLAISTFQRDVSMLKGTDDILIASSTQFKFTDTYGNTWDYVIAGDSLSRGSSRLVAPVSNSGTSFTYYAADNSTTTTISEIRLIKLLLVMDDGQTQGIPLISINYPENMRVVNV